MLLLHDVKPVGPRFSSFFALLSLGEFEFDAAWEWDCPCDEGGRGG